MTEIERIFSYEYRNGTDKPLLPADEGAWSIEGMAHATNKAAHFLAEGKVRWKAPYSDKFRVFIGPPTKGSWVSQFWIEFRDPQVWAIIAAGLSVPIGGAVFKLVRRLAQRSTGVSPSNGDELPLEDDREGTFDALQEAVEPALKRAHKVIKTNHTSLTFSAREGKFQFNRTTKEYIEASIVDDADIIFIGNVAGFSVNNGNGRVWIDDLGRTVPFSVDRHANDQTTVALARSLENYATNRISNRDVRMQCRVIRANDGTEKKLIVKHAEFAFGIRN